MIVSRFFYFLFSVFPWINLVIVSEEKSIKFINPKFINNYTITQKKI